MKNTERTERGRTWNVDLRSLRRPPFPILGSCQSSAPVPATSSAACFSAFAKASSLALLAFTANVDTATTLAVTRLPRSSTSCPLSLSRSAPGPLATVEAAGVGCDECDGGGDCVVVVVVAGDESVVMMELMEQTRAIEVVWFMVMALVALAGCGCAGLSYVGKRTPGVDPCIE